MNRGTGAYQRKIYGLTEIGIEIKSMTNSSVQNTLKIGITVLPLMPEGAFGTIGKDFLLDKRNIIASWKNWEDSEKKDCEYL